MVGSIAGSILGSVFGSILGSIVGVIVRVVVQFFGSFFKYDRFLYLVVYWSYLLVLFRFRFDVLGVFFMCMLLTLSFIDGDACCTYFHTVYGIVKSLLKSNGPVTPSSARFTSFWYHACLCGFLLRNCLTLVGRT